MQNNNVEFLGPPPVEGVGGGGTGYGWNDTGVKPSIDFLSANDVSKHPTVDFVHVWCCPSTATVGHQEPPRPLEQVCVWRMIAFLMQKIPSLFLYYYWPQAFC
jgi:hypothetical protein